MSPSRDGPSTDAPRRQGRPITADAVRCTGCLICELRCSLRFEKSFRPARAAIVIRRQTGSRDEYRISFTDGCDRCGICARYCSYRALVQDKRAGAA